MKHALWPKDSMTVSQDYDARHGIGSMPASFLWAIWTAEGSDYLEKLDANYPGRPVPDGAPHPDLVDISHVRWATSNAITALDLCAATLGHLFCGNTGGHELSLRGFDPNYGKNIQKRRQALPQPFLEWVDASLADPRYVSLHGARNPFMHSWLERLVSVTIGEPPVGHAGRTHFTVRGSSQHMNARDMVVDSASLALDRVRDFVAKVDSH